LLRSLSLSLSPSLHARWQMAMAVVWYERENPLSIEPSRLMIDEPWCGTTGQVGP
jgi:hypothetical protein